HWERLLLGVEQQRPARGWHDDREPDSGAGLRPGGCELHFCERRRLPFLRHRERSHPEHRVLLGGELERAAWQRDHRRPAYARRGVDDSVNGFLTPTPGGRYAHLHLVAP